MLTLPQALDWKRQSYIRLRVTWEAATYRHYQDQLIITPELGAGENEWFSLPFADGQLDKFPTRGGFYAFTYKYACLGFPEQDIVLYIGETNNLRERLGNHMGKRQEASQGITPVRPLPAHTDRLKYLFSTFEPLTVRFCPIKLNQKERRELERILISLLDPPFNLKHRPTPVGEPIVGKLYTIQVKEGTGTSAFTK